MGILKMKRTSSRVKR